MGKMGNKYRFLTIGFLMIVIVGLMVLYHDVQYDNDLLTERKRLLSNQLQLSMNENVKLKETILDQTKDYNRVSNLLKSKNDEFESYKTDTEQMLQRNKDIIDQLNKDVGKLESFNKLQEVTIVQLKEYNENFKNMNEDLRKNLTNQIHDNNLLMQQNLKFDISKSSVASVSEDSKKEIDMKVIQAPNAINESSSTTSSLLKANKMVLKIETSSQSLDAIKGQQKQVLEVPFSDSRNTFDNEDFEKEMEVGNDDDQPDGILKQNSIYQQTR